MIKSSPSEMVRNQELKTLRRRLTEAEDTLEAIRAGEVDAVVVNSQGNTHIYTLESPDQPFRIFVEQMQEGALTLNGDGTIIYCNRFFADLVGHPVEQVRGQPIENFIASEHQDFRELFASAADGVVRGESWLRGSKNESIPVQFAFNPLPPIDIRMYGLVVTDLTQRERAKKLEAERLAAEEAKTARDRFLAVVSHELRTPLNAILGWTQMLHRHDDLPPLLKRGLDVIERSAWTQAQLIDDLLDVSRILAGKLRLELNPVDLTESLTGSVHTIQPSAAAKSIEITTDLPETALVIRGDKDRLQQIISNLLSNAVKFTPNGGRVWVSLDKTENSARIKVRDSGIGIPFKFLTRLFDLYQQIEGSTTRRSGGLGLGLAIVKELTELHGGQVVAESDGEGQGATFTVELPLAEEGDLEDVKGAKHFSIDNTALEGLNILLVEDDQAAREVLTAILKEAGAQVLTAVNASEALDILEGPQPMQVLVSDIGLPGTDGYQLIRGVRNKGISGRLLPAIALTAFAGREERKEALLAGYQVHLSKPVDLMELCAAIANLAGLPQAK